MLLAPVGQEAVSWGSPLRARRGSELLQVTLCRTGAPEAVVWWARFSPLRKLSQEAGAPCGPCFNLRRSAGDKAVGKVLVSRREMRE